MSIKFQPQWRGKRTDRGINVSSGDYDDVRTNIAFHLQLIGCIYLRGWRAHTLRLRVPTRRYRFNNTRPNNATRSNAISRYTLAPFNPIYRRYLESSGGHARRGEHFKGGGEQTFKLFLKCFSLVTTSVSTLSNASINPPIVSIYDSWLLPRTIPIKGTSTTSKNVDRNCGYEFMKRARAYGLHACFTSSAFSNASIFYLSIIFSLFLSRVSVQQWTMDNSTKIVGTHAHEGRNENGN